MKNSTRYIFGILFSVLSGVMLLLSFPPYGIWWLAWVGFIPALFAQYRLFPLKHAHFAPTIYTAVWLGPYMARLFGTEFGPFFTYLGLLIAILIFFTSHERKFIERTGYRWFVLQGAVGWVGMEMVRATFIPLVATSAFIGYTQAPQAWIIQPVSIFSVYGMNLVIMLVNYGLSLGFIALYDHKKAESNAVPPKLARNWSIIGVGVLIIWISISLIQLNTKNVETDSVRVAALRSGLQQPAHIDDVNDDQARIAIFEKQAYEAAAQGAEVLFTSEMMFNFDPQEEYTAEFQKVARETNTYIFLSYSVIKEDQPSRNQVAVLKPDGSFYDAVYNKTHIPPGEYYDIPGGAYPVFDTVYGRMSTLICADGNYTDVTREIMNNGAQLIAAPYREFRGFGEQLWQNVTFRAVENQVPMVVTGAGTVSAIIDAQGHQVALDYNREGSQLILVEDLPLGSGEKTFYAKVGDVLGWASFGGLILFMIYQTINDQKAKKAEKSKKHK